MNHTFILSICLFFILLSQNNWGQVKIGDNPMEINPAALLELASTTKGLLLPRMTTVQRKSLSIASSPIGLLIYNTDTQEIQYLFEANVTDTKGANRQVLRWRNPSAIRIPFVRTVDPVAGQFFYDREVNQLALWDGLAWTLLGSNKDQTLMLENTQLSISNGNSVDLTDLIATATGPMGPQGPQGVQGAIGPQGPRGQTITQTLSVSALSSSNSLTLSISEGNTVTLDLSSLARLGSEIQSVEELTFDTTTNGLTVGISNGASQTVNLSQLDQDINGLDFNRATNALTIGISDGASQTISLNPLGSIVVSGTLTIDPTGSNSYTLPRAGGTNGQLLSILDEISGSTTWTTSEVDIFTSTGNTILTSVDTITHDFVLGSNQIDNITGSSDDARLFFDKIKGAFRVGHASGTTWNEINIGDRSIAFGFNTKASGDRSTAFGNATESTSYAEITLGSYNTKVTPLNATSWDVNDRLLVIGNGTSSANSSDALIILKNGNTQLNGDISIDGSISQTSTGVLYADYVFESYFNGFSRYNPSYTFFSLAEVEQFIAGNMHLPGVQSRAEIQRKGKWDLTENVRINLEKIEELFLHAIKQEKEIERQNTLLEMQYKQIEALRMMLQSYLDKNKHKS